MKTWLPACLLLLLATLGARAGTDMAEPADPPISAADGYWVPAPPPPPVVYYYPPPYYGPRYYGYGPRYYYGPHRGYWGRPGVRFYGPGISFHGRF